MPAPAGAIYLTDLGLQYKNLVVDGGTGVKVLDATDFGKVSVGAGAQAQIMEIPNYANVPFSFAAGLPYFRLFRPTTATIDINSPSGKVDRGTVANQAGRLALSAAVVGDYCYQTDTALAYVLTTAGPATNANWTALPSGAPGGVSIFNPESIEILQSGPPRGCFMLSPNKWYWF